MALARKTADFDDVRKVTFDWSAFLTSLGSGVTISTSAWEVDSGDVTLSTPTNDTTSTTVTADFSSSSPANTRPRTYRISNLITASNGEVAERSLLVSVSEQ